MKKLLAINGSPRQGGNSDQILDQFLSGIKNQDIKIEKIFLFEKNISPCTECLHCTHAPECIIDDDMTYLYSALSESDFIVISTPVFFMGPPAHLKAMIDRCQMLWCKKYIHKIVKHDDNNKRRGFLLTLGGLSEKIGERNFQGNINSIKALYHVIEVKFSGSLTYLNIDKQGDIISHPTAFSDAYDAGLNFIK